MQIVLATMLALGLTVFAAQPGRAAGSDCAVGGFVTGKSKGAIQQLLAFTTNSTFFITYAGAITTGTSDCSSSGIIKQEYEQELYVVATFDGLTGDMARGDGAYLRSFAALLGCGDENFSAFAQWSQMNAGRYIAPHDSPKAWVNAVKHDLSDDSRFSGCTRLS